jgi:hypothetical protein
MAKSGVNTGVLQGKGKEVRGSYGVASVPTDDSSVEGIARVAH